MLVLALGVTAGARWRAAQTPSAALTTQRDRSIERTLQTAVSRFDRIYSTLEGRARAIARDSALTHAVRTLSPTDERPASLFRRVETSRGDDRSSVELYDAAGRLLAWDGRRLPRTWTPPADASQPRALVASDGEILDALVVWWPVESAVQRPSSAPLGWVRATYSTRYQPPVRNRYLRGFSLQEAWSNDTGEPLAVQWSTSPAPPPDQPHRLLYGLDGTALGVVTMERPSLAQTAQETRQHYGDLLALWGVLLLGWGSVVLWYAYSRAMHPEAARQRPSWAALRRFGLAAAGWTGARFLLLMLDIPERWLPREGWGASLFDPTYLASTFGGGLLRSTGDLLITSLFAAVLSVALLHLLAPLRLRVDSVYNLGAALRDTSPEKPSAVRFLLVLISLTALVLAVVVGIAQAVRRVVLDSTLDFFSRAGLLPDPLVLVVLCALVLLVLAAVLSTVALSWGGLHLMVRHRPVYWPRGMATLSVALAVVLGVVGLYTLVQAGPRIPFIAVAIFLGTVITASTFGLVWPHGGLGQLTLRGLLPSVLALTILLYPMLYAGIDTQRRKHMEEAVSSFEAGRDPRVLFAIKQVLRTTRSLVASLPNTQEAPSPAVLDSIATRAVRSSLLSSLTAYEASFVFGAGDQIARRYSTAGIQTRPSAPAEADRVVVGILRLLMNARGGNTVVEQLHDRQQLRRSTEERFQYAGMASLPPDSAATVPPAQGASQATPTAEASRTVSSAALPAGLWVMLRVEPRSLLPGAGTGIPRVLLPDGSFSDLYADLSLAEFRNGVLARSLGRDFGRAQLDARLRTRIANGGPVWLRESVRGRTFFTYYRTATRATGAVVAARIPAVLAFDHLYHLLRLTVAALCVAAVIYLLGLYGRYRRGLLPAQQVRFRDKVLNAFLVVGVVSMVAVGVVGVQVVTGENTRVIERRLQDHLSRVEETLALEARPDEPLHRVARRLSVDSLAARVGFDLRLYDATELVATSRPRLVRDRLVDRRLPSSVYRDLYTDAYRFTVDQASVGQFTYRVGYQALPDATGQPRLIVAVPTLAQQERIEEEQARTLAYLFGALLLLVVVVMLTALLLSNALAQPIAQLREGLEAVGEGRFARVLPVNTRDEIGDLVRTFNDMRDQLAESRRKLAQQERELAWREMARQVAHEIKNPLTPMKLSIQHMRRAFPRQGVDDDRFAQLFDRITTTLIEQIEALARIANEFSTFARLPTRVLEPLDLNDVLREAVRLMREEEAGTTVHLDLHEEPLVVEADREELRRLYINLLKNALQSIPPERDGEIHVCTERTRTGGDVAPHAYSSITDNGTGIPADLRDKIFQPNFSTKTSGTGLGLAIAKKSIEELDGHIDFETTEGQGTTFRIWLPLSEEATVTASG
jgi:signal transduction histidine kinase